MRGRGERMRRGIPRVCERDASKAPPMIDRWPIRSPTGPGPPGPPLAWSKIIRPESASAFFRSASLARSEAALFSTLAFFHFRKTSSVMGVRASTLRRSSSTSSSMLLWFSFSSAIRAAS